MVYFLSLIKDPFPLFCQHRTDHTKSSVIDASPWKKVMLFFLTDVQHHLSKSVRLDPFASLI